MQDKTVQQPRPAVFWIRAGTVIAAVALLGASLPIIGAAVQAGLGLFALAAMGVVGIAFTQAMPLLMQKLENRLLAARKQEARTNPVEQLHHECMRREQRLESFRRALIHIGGKIESMEQMLSDRAHADPQHVLDRQRRALERMRHFYRCNLERLDEAQSALEAFQRQVKQKMFEWEFARAGQVVMSALRPESMEDLMQDLLTDEALKSIQDRFNQVFAELDVELHSINAPTYEMLCEAKREALEGLSVAKLPMWRQS
jgi:hypothetical protein